MIFINNIMAKLAAWCVLRALQQPCPDRIPRSGEAGRTIRCNTVQIKSDARYAYIESVDGLRVRGVWVRGSEIDPGQRDVEMDLRQIAWRDILINSYHGLYEAYYDKGIIEYLLFGVTGWYPLRIGWLRARNRVNQFFYNFRNIQIKNRYFLLEFIVKNYLDGSEFTVIQVMNDLNGVWWYAHPRRDEVRTSIELYLGAFAREQLLDETTRNLGFRIRGEALIKLAEYEEAERRHLDSSRLQRWIVALTMVLVVVGLVQAGIVKVPVVLNLDKISDCKTLGDYVGVRDCMKRVGL